MPALRTSRKLGSFVDKKKVRKVETMQRFIVFITAGILMVAGTTFAADHEIRDRDGKLIGTWRDRGNGTSEFRDRNGNLNVDRTRQGGNWIYRDRNGTIVGEERRK